MKWRKQYKAAQQRRKVKIARFQSGKNSVPQERAMAQPLQGPSRQQSPLSSMFGVNTGLTGLFGLK